MAPCRFWLGTHMPAWLGLTDAPLFLSRRPLVRRRSLPPALGEWALDSGGFSELSLFGRWTVRPEEYIAEVRKWRSAAGGLLWCAQMDWMCEPSIRSKTGLTTRDHQERTVANYLELTQMARAPLHRRRAEPRADDPVGLTGHLGRMAHADLDADHELSNAPAE